MKKITFFTDSIYPAGGTERVTIMIANELSKKYDVEIISLHKSADKPFYEISDKVKVIDLNAPRFEPLIFKLPFAYRFVKKMLKNYNTDVFVCSGMRYVPISIFMRKKTKYVAWEHYTSFVNKKWSVGELGRKIASKKADKIIILTKKDVDKNRELFKTPADKIVQIYNANESKATSKEYDINSKLIISAGRFNEQKGYDMLVDVAEKVFSKHSDWQWHIYGDGKLFDDIKNKIQEKGLENNLVLKGIEKNLYNKYQEYAMYVLTSRYEGLGMVIVEAQCAKLPVVSFNCACGPDELILDNENGYLIDCFNIDSMAEKINYLIEHPEIRQKFSNNSNLDKDKLRIENIIVLWKRTIEDDFFEQ